MQFPVKSKSQSAIAATSNDRELGAFVRETIRRDGPVTFAWFMQQALYHPTLGYYSSGWAATGRRGDYFTNVSVGPLFGRLLARQFVEMWETLGRPAPFAIVEQGAHSGDFAADVLNATRADAPEFFSALRYVIVEPFPALQRKQEQQLREFRDRVSWFADPESLDPFSGVHFSNELFDALPVHLVRQTETGEWRERYVALCGEDLKFQDGELSDERLARVISNFPELPAPYETEICVAAADLLALLAQKLTRGYLLAVDYGHSRAEYYSPTRTTGTLQCCANHRVLPSPLRQIGFADITAHVDWTALADTALAHGLCVIGFTDQHRFLTGVIGKFPDAIHGDDRDRRALQTLLHPTLLGSVFQFLCLARGVAPETRLSGFQFARDPRPTLGLPATDAA